MYNIIESIDNQNYIISASIYQNKNTITTLKTAFLSKVYNLPNQEYTNVTLSLFVQVNPVDISL